MPSAYQTSLLGQCYDLGLLQVVRSRFSNVMCPKNEIMVREKENGQKNKQKNLKMPPVTNGQKKLLCNQGECICLADCGNETDQTSVKVYLRPLETPPQAFLCELEGFTPADGFWNDDDDKPLTIIVQNVKDTNGKDKIFVEFIDFGNEATVSPMNVCKLDEQFMQFSRFGIHCHLNKDHVRIQEGVDQRQCLFCDEKLYCKFIQENNNIWEVKIAEKHFA
ncbi:hypothetical protein P4O66_011705 [Electrophorus voltai]|uniref:Tudor domain-containing protein n=1 Tax=Electrophorus voltai TaxID=2609070 RepID=A0AAD8Z679_9TELE|nr:hypothetical protein P4O66_011705 [Electrophorus voltai]